MRTKRNAISVTTAAALFLAACSNPEVVIPERPTDQADGTIVNPDYDPTEGIDSDLEEYYSQDVVWNDCGGSTSFECTDITVPLDYDDPSGETITIAVERTAESGPSRSLLLNPGGPGGSGTDMVEWSVMLFSREVRDEYRIVGFDPRGVATSSAIECVSDEEMDAWNAESIDTSTEEGVDQMLAAYQEFADACQANSGDLMEFVDTESVVRDMDIIRAVISRTDQLDFFGFSYGTLLGSVYADLFTDRVGTFVLDGALDPSSSVSDLSWGQAEGFDVALRSYLQDCLDGTNCWFSGSVDDGLAQIRTLFDQTLATPLPTSDPDRPLTQSLAMSGVITAMYTTYYWPQLTSALDQAINEGDGTRLLGIADEGNSRNADGTYDGNGSEAFMAINCLDYPVEGDRESWRQEAEDIAAAYPTFGDGMAWSDAVCSVYPYQATEPREEIHAEGSNPILVIGTTRDPATPYQWAIELADQLENGHLLTYDGDGHTAYGNDLCINDAVDAFLVDGTIPPEGTTCGG